MSSDSTLVRAAAGTEVSRRQFLLWAIAGAFGLALADLARAVLTYLRPQATAGFGGVIDAGAVADFPSGSVTPIRRGRFAIVHTPDGLLALYQRCTHLGCLPPWDAAQGIFACPCHAGRYNMLGEVLGGPPPRPLDRFAIALEDGRVRVDTRTPLERQRYEPQQATPVQL